MHERVNSEASCAPRQVRVPERAERYRTRNQAIRDWVAAHPGHAGFVDFEARLPHIATCSDPAPVLLSCALILVSRSKSISHTTSLPHT